MTAATLLGSWYRSSIVHSKSTTKRLVQWLSNGPGYFANEAASFIQEWTPFLLVLSYFVFSISLYMFCTERVIEMFWFLYLTTNFYIAGSTVLEALISVGPCRDARLAVQKAQEKNWVFPTPNHELVFLDLLIVSVSIRPCPRD